MITECSKAKVAQGNDQKLRVGWERTFVNAESRLVKRKLRKPGNPGRIQIGRFISVEIFRWKSNTFQAVTFFILRMVQLNPVPVLGAKKLPVPFDRNFSPNPCHNIWYLPKCNSLIGLY